MHTQGESSYLLKVVSYFAKDYSLTQREQEIVFYLTKYGYSNKHLATELFIAEKTVKNHIAKIQEKTKAGSTRELLSMVVAQFLLYQDEEEALVLR
ncbi:hypothetical protein KCTCHS21_58160 [Cohnella abietis]|uniref:HTH luxR-type domain-containing protein n=1 Tax=Cohnella abietis TaxID=2507935 RepID=A0A3T1DE86_9BACL|nr:hypothetical protein KCTCHS21_58160 [Cohnella abietis]